MLVLRKCILSLSFSPFTRCVQASALHREKLPVAAHHADSELSSPSGSLAAFQCLGNFDLNYAHGLRTS